MCSVPESPPARVIELKVGEPIPPVSLEESDLNEIDRTHIWDPYVKVTQTTMWKCRKCGSKISKSWFMTERPDSDFRRFTMFIDKYEPHVTCPEMVAILVMKE